MKQRWLKKLRAHSIRACRSGVSRSATVLLLAGWLAVAAQAGPSLTSAPDVRAIRKLIESYVEGHNRSDLHLAVGMFREDMPVIREALEYQKDSKFSIAEYENLFRNRSFTVAASNVLIDVRGESTNASFTVGLEVYAAGRSGHLFVRF